MRLSTLLAGGGLAFCVAVDAYLLLIDVYHGQQCSADTNGTVVCRDVSRTFLAENGDRFISMLIIPTVLALLVLVLTLPGVHLSRFFLWFAVVVFFAFCLVTGFSIGLLYAAAMLLCLLAAVVRQ